MTFSNVLTRGLLKRCPQCGKGKIFTGWNTVCERCAYCGCDLERRGGDSWFFTYMSTAFLTGILILFMWQCQLSSLFIEQVIIVAGWFVMIVLTLPNRKSLAIAMDYWMEEKLSEK